MAIRRLFVSATLAGLGLLVGCTQAPSTSTPTLRAASATTPPRATVPRPTTAVPPPEASATDTPRALPVSSLPAGDYVGMMTFEDNVASIEVISIDSGARYMLGELEYVGPDASIDPSGVKLLVSTRDPDFRFPSAMAGLAVFDLENHTLTSLPNASDCHGGSWSPDGVYVAAVCMAEDPEFGARQDVVVISVSSGDRWPMTGPSYSGEAYSSPVWSPDGNRIAYAVLPAGQVPDPKDGLYVVAGDCFSRPGSCPSSATHAVVGPLGGPYGDVRWSPTDPQLAYIEDGSVVVYSPTLGEISRIEFPSAPTSLAWSPSGDGLAVTTEPSASSSTLYMAALPQGDLSLVKHLPGAYARFWLSIP